MLRFNNTRKIHLFLLKTISIHLMLRFNGFISNIRHSLFIFQYILCYGSTEKLQLVSQSKQYFNTSYVTVQLPSFISMLVGFIDFNTSYVTVQPCARGNFGNRRKKFQYILCYGSTFRTFLPLYLLSYFNTSYVTVQHLLYLI